MSKKPFGVLMAEDVSHDIIATQRAWKKSHILNPLYIVKDGEECLDFLHQRGNIATLKVPPGQRFYY
jgi:two-component system response regulator